jgi:hypothetical protein
MDTYKKVVCLFGQQTPLVPKTVGKIRLGFTLLIAVALVATWMLLSSCSDAAYFTSRTLFQLECNPAKTHSSQCVAVKKGE